ncbi:MAG: hypothetical protein MR765_06765 [Tenericutes bacterium]|nr:hypothetical protein [Mycoplasmatota bacterium]
MNTDVALNYKAKLIQVEDKIEEIERIGFNIKPFREELENIIIDTNSKVKTSKNKKFEGFIIIDYSNAMTRLEKLDISLDSFEIYIKVKNYAEYLDKNYIKEDRINEIIGEIKKLLRSLGNSSVIDYEEEKKIVEPFYTGVFKVICFEIYYTGKSTLLEFCKASEIDKSFIERKIKTAVDEINFKKYPEIEAKYYEIKRNGSNSSLLDNDFLKLMVFKDEKDRLKNVITVPANIMVKNIELVEKDIKEKYRDYLNTEKRYEDSIKTFKLEFKELMKSIVAVAIALSIPVASFSLFNFLGKKLFKEYSYDVSKDTYSSYDNSFTHSDERMIIDEPAKKAYVVKYDILTSDDIDDYNSKRNYNSRIKEEDAMWYRRKTIYDLSYLKYQDINGYLDYWNSNATVPVNSSEIVNIKDNSDIIQEYTDYYELVCNIIDLKSKNAEACSESIAFSIILTIFAIAIEAAFVSCNLSNDYYHESKLCLINRFIEYISAKENLKNDKKLFLEQTKDLLALIGQDEKLRTVFNIEAAKYGDLFEQMGIKLPKEALDNNAKKKIKNMR